MGHHAPTFNRATRSSAGQILNHHMPKHHNGFCTCTMLSFPDCADDSMRAGFEG